MQGTGGGGGEAADVGGGGRRHAMEYGWWVTGTGDALLRRERLGDCSKYRAGWRASQIMRSVCQNPRRIAIEMTYILFVKFNERYIFKQKFFVFISTISHKLIQFSLSFIL